MQADSIALRTDAVPVNPGPQPVADDVKKWDDKKLYACFTEDQRDSIRKAATGCALSGISAMLIGQIPGRDSTAFAWLAAFVAFVFFVVYSVRRGRATDIVVERVKSEYDTLFKSWEQQDEAWRPYIEAKLKEPRRLAARAGVDFDEVVRVVRGCQPEDAPQPLSQGEYDDWSLHVIRHNKAVARENAQAEADHRARMEGAAMVTAVSTALGAAAAVSANRKLGQMQRASADKWPPTFGS